MRMMKQVGSERERGITERDHGIRGIHGKILKEISTGGGYFFAPPIDAISDVLGA